MARQYVVTFSAVAVSAAQDLLFVKGSTGKIVRIKRVVMGCVDTSLVTAQSFKIRCQFLPVTVTNGSGGSAQTPNLLDPGDSAAAATGRKNDTTPATSNGTAVDVLDVGVHAYAGLDFTFPNPVILGLNQAFTFGLLSTPSGTVTMSASVYFEEEGL